MPKSTFLLVIIVLFSMVISGCTLQTPRNNKSCSAIPAIIMDYNEYDDVVGIWIESAMGADYKYNKITVEISWGNHKEFEFMNYTYCLVTNTYLKKFYINVTTYIGEDIYVYSGLVELYPEDEYIFSITKIDEFEPDLQEELIEEQDLPWKNLLKKKD